MKMLRNFTIRFVMLTILGIFCVMWAGVGLYSTWSLSRVSDGNDVDRQLVRQMTVLSQGNDQYFRFVTRLSRAMEVKAAGGTPDLAPAQQALDPPPPQRRPDGRRRQGLCRCTRIYARGARCKPRFHHPRPQGTRRVGVRHGSRRRHDPHRRGPARPGRHRHRQRGQRHEPPCRRELRSQGQYSPEGPHFIPECLDGRRRAAV